MGWCHLPQLCPSGLDSAGAETSSKKGCCKVNMLPCFPEDLLKWTSSFIKWVTFFLIKQLRSNKASSLSGHIKAFAPVAEQSSAQGLPSKFSQSWASLWEEANLV